MLKNLPANVGDTRDTGSIQGLGRLTGGRNGNSISVFLQGKFHGQRILADCGPRGLQRVGHDWATEHGALFSTLGVINT